MPDAQPVIVARTARGLVATVALFTVGFAALLTLTWSCCSTPSLHERLGNILAVVPAGVVALVALPPLTKRVRARGWRWWLLPFVIADLWLCARLGAQAVRELGQGAANREEALYFFAPFLVPNLICAVYVAWRVVLKPPAT